MIGNWTETGSQWQIKDLLIYHCANITCVMDASTHSLLSCGGCEVLLRFPEFGVQQSMNIHSDISIILSVLHLT